MRALSYRSEKLPQFPNIEWVTCDLLDVVALEEAMKGVRKLYHCAATVSFHPKDKQRLLLDNETMTENVVNAALFEGVKRMVHVSSVAALGRNAQAAKGKPITEEQYFEEGGENSRYAIGKYLSEMQVWRGIAEGLEAVILNPAIILGAGDWTKGSAHLMQVCYDEFPYFTDGLTAWVGVKDVVQALLLLMDSELNGERFIFSEGNHSYRKIFNLMAESVGKRPPRLKAKRWQSELIWRLSWLKGKLLQKEVSITKETARAAHRSYRYSSEKWLKTFPEFNFTPIEEVIKEMGVAFLEDKKAP